MKAIAGSVGFVVALLASTGANAAGSLLRVTCDGGNAGAEVFIDGKFKGECPVDIQIEEGQHKLRAVKTVDDSREQVFEQDIRMGDGVVKKVETVLSAPQLTAEGKKLEEQRLAVERVEAQKRESERLRIEAENRARVEQALAELRQQGAVPGNGIPFRDCADCPEMVLIPPGSFDMGSNNGMSGEQPVHRVTIGSAFAMGKTEITRGQFAAFVNETGHNTSDKCFIWDDGWKEQDGKSWRNPGYKQDDSHPVACINWNDAQAYTEWMSRKTGKRYRLPTEAEWEYACRAAGRHEYCGGNDLGSIAWYEGNSSAGLFSSGSTRPAAGKQPNSFGLYDMSGNVWEWTADFAYTNYIDAPGDGSARQGNGAMRVLRGGSWIKDPQCARSASRDWFEAARRDYSYGFRLARTLP